MHSVFNSNFIPGKHDYAEMCPHCNSLVPVLIDKEEHACYETICPVCKKNLMLCSICHWENEKTKDPHGCNWSPVNGCYRQIFTIETYPPVFSDYKNHVENDNYDDTIRIFSVPKCWALKWIKEHDFTFDEFISTYNWDISFQMYGDAIKEKVIVCEKIENR